MMPPPYRAMSLGSVREDAMKRRNAPHIEAVNRLVEALRTEGQARVPYVDARYGGVDSQVLFLFQDPGPGTDDTQHGSGFLSPQNDDPSAERFLRCLEDAGLELNRVITWNAYPWILLPGEGLGARRLMEGLDPLRRLLGLLPRLRVVVTMGRMAEGSWKRLADRQPTVASTYHVIRSLHTSGRGITNGSRHTAAEGRERVCDAMREALEVVLAAEGTEQRAGLANVKPNEESEAGSG